MATTPRPPPIPRRHPSRPSLSGRITPSSPSASNTSLPLRDASPPPPLPTPPSTALELASSRPSSRGANGNRARPSTLLIGSSQTSAHAHGQSAQNTSPNGLPASPSIGRRGPGAVGLGAASTVGLGPARIDFKDWVKAGRDGASASPEEEQRHGHASHHRLSPTHNAAATSYNSFSPSTRRQKEPSPAFSTSSTSGAESDVVRRPGRSGVYRHHHRHTSSSGTTTPPNRPESSTAQRLLRTSSMASSNSMGSLSIDSSRSPQGMPSRITERLNAVATEARLISHSTPRHLSHDLSRELNTSTNSRASRGSRQLSLHSPSFGSPGSPSGDRRYSAPAVASPLERRFSRRLATRDSAGTPPRVDEEAVEVLSPRHDSSLDDRIHEAEAKLARSSSTRNVSNTDERTSPLRRFHSVNHSRSESGHFTPGLRDRPNGNNYGPEPGDYERREYGSGGRLAKTRNPIPSEFQNGRGLFTPPPKPEQPRRFSHLVELGDSPRSPRGSFDLGRSPRGSSFDAGRSERSFTTARPASVMETSREPRGGWGRPSSVMAHPLSRAEFDQFNSPIGRRRDLASLSNGRPESVLETSADHHRYNTHGPSSNRLSNYSHDGYGGGNRQSGYDRHSQYSTDVPSRYSTYSSDRQSFYSQDGGSNRLSALVERDTQLRRDSHVRDSNSRIGPNDSVSVVNGSRNDPPNSARKDPLEMIRKIEETRVQTKQRWDEDRSASVMSVRNDDVHTSRYAGDREVLSGRASSRLDDTRVPSRMNAGSRLGGPRPSSSMSSMRDGYAPNSAPRAAPNTAPVTRRRTNSDEHSLLESPLIGRSSRASVLSTEPSRVLRSQMTQRSQTSGSDQPITEHGRLLVDAARMAETRLGETNPELVAKLDAAAQGAERANAGVRAAAAIASELVIDVEVDDAAAVATVRDRLPRLSVTLREAGRMSDRAVRDLTDALLAVRGGASTPSRGPLSSQGTGGDPAHRRAWSQTLDGRETPSSRHSTSLSSASMQSPLLRYRDRDLHARETTPVRHEASSSVSSSRYDPLPSATSVTSGGSNRFEGGFPSSRTLDPIEQSPPKPMSRQSPKTVTRSNTLNGLSTKLQAPEDWAQGTLVSPNVSAEMEEDESESEPEPDTDGYVVPEPEGRSTPRERPPRAPERGSPAEHGLRKQSSLASTHTVRGNSFIPNQSEPTTALTSSTAYSTQLSHAHADPPTAAQAHARRISSGSAVSGVSAAAALTERALADRPTSLHRDSILSVGSQYSTGTSPERDTERGTFGAAEGARIRASVSERFRKHLSGGD